MSTLIRSALIALVLVGGASAASARPVNGLALTDQSDAFGGFSPNSQEGARAFWDNQARRGGN